MRKKIILFLGLLLSVVAFGQETFNDAMKIPEKWSSWMSYEVLCSQYYRKNPASWDYSVNSMGYGEFGSGDERTIAFPKYNYLIKGCFLQGRLKDTWIVKVFDNSNGEKIILEGGAWYSNEICYVKGIHHLYTGKGEEKIYGTFILSNTDNQRLVFKKKDAQELEISCVSYDYYYGYYLNCPTLLESRSTDGESKIFVDGESGNRSYSFFSATLSDTINCHCSVPTLFDALMLASHNATMSHSNGDIFHGKVHTNSIGDSIVGFDWLEGKFKTHDWNKEVWIKNGIFYFSKETNNNKDFNAKAQVYMMPKGFSPKIHNYWDEDSYILNCDTAFIFFQDGRKFKGRITSKVEFGSDSSYSKITSTLLSGKLWYSNGDVYEGDFLTTNGPFFTGGKTILADGTVLNGDWISSYKLTSEQRDKVYEADNPSDAWKIISKVFYITYRKDFRGNGIWIDVFSNGSEEVIPKRCDKVLFEKKTGIYQCFSKDGSYEVDVEVDQEKRPIQQDVYENGELSYMVCYSWYSNGRIQSIKTYDGKGFLMKACNFFSDGYLRSAYEYCTGNNGGRILRKSKESHPTFGGYETKLYDLDGNYERSIKWSIGDEDVFWRPKMAPCSMKESLKDCIEE